MSDPRNKIDCSKCHNDKCALAGKEFNMAACTGYKPLTHYDELHSMNVEQLAEWIDENSCYIIQEIKDDADYDNMQRLVDLIHVYEKCKQEVDDAKDQPAP